MLDVLSPQKGDTPRGGVGSPRRGRFGQTTLTQTTSVLATLFAAGCLVGLALSTDSSVPTHTAHALSAGSAEVDKSVSLLMLLNLDHYAPLVKRRRMSVCFDCFFFLNKVLWKDCGVDLQLVVKFFNFFCKVSPHF